MESRRQRSRLSKSELNRLMGEPWKGVIKAKGQPYIDRDATEKDATHIEWLRPTIIHASVAWAYGRIVKAKKFCYQRNFLHWR